jgi:hypothetical protein
MLNEIIKIPKFALSIGFFTLCPNGTIFDLDFFDKFPENYIYYTKDLIEEFSPKLTSEIYKNKGKRMLVDHTENTLISGHFDGKASDTGIILIKKTDTEDYKKEGIGEIAVINTTQVSNFENGTLINSTQNSKIEIPFINRA